MRPEKKCPDCGEHKPPEAFSRHPNTADRKQPYCKPCTKERQREIAIRLHGDTRHYHLKSRYGVTAREINEMSERQGGLCAICREDAANQVDHDHQTKEIRGLLCDGCNGGLGAFEDDPDLIQRAIDYLEKWK